MFCSVAASDGSTEATTRPKRKDRVSKHKSTSSKSKRNDDAIHKLKVYINKENPPAQKTLLSLLTRGRVSQKVGLYGKGKSSQTISRRKPLSSIKEDNTVEDLQKILSDSPKSPQVSNITILPKGKSIDVSHDQSHDKSHDQRRIKSQCRLKQVRQKELLSASAEDFSSPEQNLMDISVEKEKKRVKVPLKDIAETVLSGLRPDEMFDAPDYLSTVRAELRKIMKQNDPAAFTELETCLSGNKKSTTQSPPPPPPPLPLSLPSHSCVYPEECRNVTTQASCSGSFVSSSSTAMETNSLNSFSEDKSNSVQLWLPLDQPIDLTNKDPPSFQIPIDQHDMEQSCSSYFTDINTELAQNSDLLDSLDNTCSIVSISDSVERPQMFPHRLY